MNSIIPKTVQASSNSPQDAFNNFPIAYFLDHQVYSHCHLAVQKPQVPLPAGILNMVNNPDSIRNITDQFFQSVHLWLPIVCRSKFYGNILQHAPPKDADLALLVVCMKLVLPQQAKQGRSTSRTYALVKTQFVQLEQSGFLTITMLQAMILVAIYEKGHGIYPAAYLTVGSCARYAVALGLDRTIFEWDNGFFEWTCVEEKHRAWWAVVILERYILSGCLESSN